MTRAIEAAARSQVVTIEEGIAKTIDWYLTRRDYWEPSLGDRYDTPRLGALT